ncbi:MAG: hypothetical protein J5842_07230 [Lachnospiraceae bacterium]|nr:hypothetical protein [Lachnospiraceae bacterium]
MLKSHKAIVGSRYFYITYIILPAVFTLLGIIYRLLFHKVSFEFFLLVQSFVMLYEVSTEYFGYGPIYRKNNLGMEYLKTSVSGMELFRKSILADLLLRAARSMAYTLIPAAIVFNSTGDLLLLLISAFLLADISVWSVTFTRYVTMYGFLMLVSAPLMAFGLITENLCTFFPVIKLPVLIAAVLLLPAGVLFSTKFADKKIKASYIDIR